MSNNRIQINLFLSHCSYIPYYWIHWGHAHHANCISRCFSCSTSIKLICRCRTCSRISHYNCLSPWTLFPPLTQSGWGTPGYSLPCVSTAFPNHHYYSYWMEYIRSFPFLCQYSLSMSPILFVPWKSIPNTLVASTWSGIKQYYCYSRVGGKIFKCNLDAITHLGPQYICLSYFLIACVSHSNVGIMDMNRTTGL